MLIILSFIILNNCIKFRDSIKLVLFGHTSVTPIPAQKSTPSIYGMYLTNNSGQEI